MGISNVTSYWRNGNLVFYEIVTGVELLELSAEYLSVMLNAIGLNTSILSEPTAIGSISWSDADRTAQIKLTNDVTLSIGQELMAPRCTNKTGVDILNGQVVYISGAQGSRPTIDLADATTYSSSYKTIGLTTENINDNDEGFVTISGLVHDVDTSAWEAGTCLYLDTTAGQMTDTPPSDGYPRIFVGMVIYSHAQHGIICVRIHDDKYMFGDIDNSNYTLFESNGVIRSVGTSQTWEDLQFQVSGGKVPAVNFPSFETFTTNTMEYAFGVNEYIDLSANEPPHSHVLDSTGSFHIHVTPKSANATGSDRFVKIQIIVAKAAVGSVWTETTLSAELTIPTGTSALQHFLLSLGSFDLTGLGIGGQLKIQLKRIAATGGTEFADDVFLTQVGLHYKQDTMGSRSVASK